MEPLFKTHIPTQCNVLDVYMHGHLKYYTSSQTTSFSQQRLLQSRWANSINDYIQLFLENILGGKYPYFENLNWRSCCTTNKSSLAIIQH